MQRHWSAKSTSAWLLAIAVLLLVAAPGAVAQDQAAKPAAQTTAPRLDLYGFAMLDFGHNFGSINPNWSDTLRVSKLPSFDKQFGKDGNTFAGVRQTRFGVKGFIPSELGEIKTIFEFELFGTGVDEGQTTFRLRHAYGEIGHFGAGQYWSPFMDIDVFPNSLEYWGPTGMVFFRNVQFRYMPLQGEKELVFAVERPGASADQGVYSDRIELQGVKGRFPVPDFSGHYRYSQKWGYVQGAFLLGYMRWDDVGTGPHDLSGSATRWGFNLSGNFKPTANDTVRGALVYGEGIENYMNDAPVDVGIVNQFNNPITPIAGKALPITGITLFLDHNWNKKWSTAVGYSTTNIKNTEGQLGDAYHMGRYFLGNLLYSPVSGVMVGGEVQWGQRSNFNDGFKYSATKIQFSFKYNFAASIGGK
ncbi:MAG: DcaP family trimeric outer membrane transporter [Bacteroidales bacterium]